MQFESKRIQQNGLDVHVLKNLESGTEVHILPEYGALWHAWLVKKEGEIINLIDNYKDRDELDRFLRDSHKSAKLSPFACRIADAKYTFRDTDYVFQNKFKDGNAIHGLLVDRAFECKETKESENQIQSTFIYHYKGDDTGYPWAFDCEITYKLFADDKVTVETTISNKSDADIPVVDGWHPYFKTGSKIDDCLLHFQAENMIEFDDKLVPTGKKIPFDRFNSPQKVGNIQLDNAFYYKRVSGKPELQLTDSQNGIRISIQDLKNYPILQMYIPPTRASIAIEPLSGAPDAFNNGMDLVVLSPKTEKTFSASFTVETEIE